MLLLNTLQYWGRAKHRYRDVYKDRFDAAKRITCESLNMCPMDVVRRFFNCSWWFMDAYRQGLMGKAAKWAVHKQKAHRPVGQRAMMAIEAVLN
jgi:hypothetical protein